LFDRKFLPALPDLIRLLWILGAWTVVSFDAYALLRRVPGFLKAIDQMNWSVVKNGASA
jgi:hypothetical protein